MCGFIYLLRNLFIIAFYLWTSVLHMRKLSQLFKYLAQVHTTQKHWDSNLDTFESKARYRKPAVLKFLNFRTSLLSQIILSPNKLLLMWVLSINFYNIGNLNGYIYTF